MYGPIAISPPPNGNPRTALDPRPRQQRITFLLHGLSQLLLRLVFKYIY